MLPDMEKVLTWPVFHYSIVLSSSVMGFAKKLSWPVISTTQFSSHMKCIKKRMLGILKVRALWLRPDSFLADCVRVTR